MCASAESSTTCSMASFIRPEVALIIGSVSFYIVRTQACRLHIQGKPPIQWAVYNGGAMQVMAHHMGRISLPIAQFRVSFQHFPAPFESYTTNKLTTVRSEERRVGKECRTR